MMHKESELSQWFNLSEQKPWQPGVYPVTIASKDHAGSFYSFNRSWYAYWDGFKFSRSSESFKSASKYSWLEEDSWILVYEWRGLSYDPSLPNKLVRRTDPATSKEAAAKVVKSGALKSHCAKIRACLVEHGRMTPSEIAAKLKMRRSSVFRRMSDLKRGGFASRTGEKRGGQSVWNDI